MQRKPLLVLAAAFLVLAIAFGIRQSFGLFLAPISRDLGWSFSVFALAMGVQNFLWGCTQPIAGAIADRWGTGRVIAGGAALYVIGVAMMSAAETPADLHIGLGVLIGLGASGTAFPVVLTAVARAFPKERHSTVMGMATAGVSLGQLTFSPLSPVLMGEIGWSATLALYAAAAALMVLLAVPLMSAPAAGGASGAGQTMRAALREAGGHSGFLLLNAGFFVCGFHVTLIMTHLPAFTVLCGLAPMVGATAIAVIGLFNLIGTNLAGVLGDRYRKKHLLSGIYLARAAVIAAYIGFPVTETTTLLFAATVGLLWLSTVPLTSGLVGQIFGTQYLGTLFGVVFFSHQLGAFLGAWLGGWLYDATGSYTGVWLIAIALGLFAAVVHWPIADRPVARLAPAPAQ